MDTAAALADIQAILAEAGALAVRAQKGVRTTYKDGNQALTETDLAISRLTQARLAPWLSQPGHVLLDEESIDQAGTPDKVFAETEYQWVLDPIDGTAGYALGRKLYGISLGLLHRGVPLLGGIYLPAQKELLLADTTRAWRVENAFTADAVESPLQCEAMPVHNQIFVESYFGHLHPWNSQGPSSQHIWLNTPESAVQGLFTALTGQAAASTMVRMFSIWDVAAALAMAKRASFAVKSMTDGRLWERLTAADFQPNWKLADTWLLSAEQNYTVVRDALTGDSR